MEMSRAVQGDAGSAPVEVANPYEGMSVRDAREALERDLIAGALDRNEGNVKFAAEELGYSRGHLHRRIQLLGLSWAGAKAAPATAHEPAEGAP